MGNIGAVTLSTHQRGRTVTVIPVPVGNYSKLLLRSSRQKISKLTLEQHKAETSYMFVQSIYLGRKNNFIMISKSVYSGYAKSEHPESGSGEKTLRKTEQPIIQQHPSHKVTSNGAC